MSTTASSTFTVALVDQTSGPATSAARALDKLGAKIASDTRALREMQAAMRQLQGGKVVDVSAFRTLQGKIDGLKQSIATGRSEFLQLGGTFGRVAKAAKPPADALGNLHGPAAKAANGLAEIRGAAQALPGPLGSVVGKLTALGGATAGGLIAIGLVGVAAGIAAVTAAAITGAAALLRYGITQADALRKEELQRQRAIAIATGDARLLASVVGRRALSIDKQVERLHKHLADLFSGLRIEGLLSKMGTLVSLFSQSTVTGRALKQLVEVLLQPMIGALEYIAPLARRFFQGMVLGAQRLTIAALRVAVWLKKAFAGSDLLSGIDLMSVALEGGSIVVYALAAAVVTSVVAIGALVVGLGVLAALVAVLVVTLAAPFILAGLAIYGLVRAGMAVYEWFQGVDWSALGTSILDGIVGGLTAGADLLMESVRALATGAAGAFKDALGIASPSRVFADLGLQVSRGVAQGVDEGAPDADRAVTGMLSTPQAQGRAAAQSSVSIAVGDIHIHAGANASPRDMAVSVRDELARVLEGLAIQVGAAT